MPTWSPSSCRGLLNCSPVGQAQHAARHRQGLQHAAHARQVRPHHRIQRRRQRRVMAIHQVARRPAHPKLLRVADCSTSRLGMVLATVTPGYDSCYMAAVPSVIGRAVDLYTSIGTPDGGGAIERREGSTRDSRIPLCSTWLTYPTTALFIALIGRGPSVRPVSSSTIYGATYGATRRPSTWCRRE